MTNQLLSIMAFFHAESSFTSTENLTPFRAKLAFSTQIIFTVFFLYFLNLQLCVYSHSV